MKNVRWSWSLVLWLFPLFCYAQIDLPKQSEIQPGAFIVAFELRPEKGELLWPPTTIQPYPADQLLLLVERMPRVREAQNSSGESQPLAAEKHLRINGSVPKPVKANSKGGARKQYFLVNLDQGRLRLSLFLPPGSQLDPQFKTAAVRLFQIAK